MWCVLAFSMVNHTDINSPGTFCFCFFFTVFKENCSLAEDSVGLWLGKTFSLDNEV